MTGPDHTDGRQHLHGLRYVHGYNHLIHMLAKAREAQGISVRELAHRIGEHQPNVSRTLLGKCRARPDRLIAIADALGYDLALIPRHPATGDDT